MTQNQFLISKICNRCHETKTAPLANSMVYPWICDECAGAETMEAFVPSEYIQEAPKQDLFIPAEKDQLLDLIRLLSHAYSFGSVEDTLNDGRKVKIQITG